MGGGGGGGEGVGQGGKVGVKMSTKVIVASTVLYFGVPLLCTASTSFADALGLSCAMSIAMCGRVNDDGCS